MMGLLPSLPGVYVRISLARRLRGLLLPTSLGFGGFSCGSVRKHMCARIYLGILAIVRCTSLGQNIPIASCPKKNKFWTSFLLGLVMHAAWVCRLGESFRCIMVHIRLSSNYGAFSSHHMENGAAPTESSTASSAANSATKVLDSSKTTEVDPSLSSSPAPKSSEPPEGSTVYLERVKDNKYGWRQIIASRFSTVSACV